MAKVLLTGVSGKTGVNVLRNIDKVLSPDDDIYILQNKNLVNIRDVPIKGDVYIITSLSHTREYDTAIHFAGNIHTSRGRDPANYHEFQRDNIDLTRRVCVSANHVLFASTDYIFSGMDDRDYKESDEPNQTNFYGQTKASAEKVVLEHAGAAIRFTYPIGIPSNLIIDKIFNALEGRPAWPFWNNQYIGLSLFDDTLNVFKKVSETKRNGIYHVTCEGGSLSRADLAKKVLGVYRTYDIERVSDSIEEEPCSDPLFPRRLGLDTTQTRKELGIESFTSLDEAIRMHVLRAKKPEALHSNGEYSVGTTQLSF